MLRIHKSLQGYVQKGQIYSNLIAAMIHKQIHLTNNTSKF